MLTSVSPFVMCWSAI
ncbi:hypothetical protein D884_00802 [Pseudomonas sp. URMO17WK12:I10]|nr:hypothetical protein F477_00447 [Pseudomonas sp. URIL14HWK12:I3]RED13572.1 hypothetical protein D884_00802 [Pseudomonas sp. URMO17WK12:I10]SOD05805.1 hypothetical protein SAMN05660967_00442 [Pseudomonas sp. URMO17WK12:I9]